MNCQNFSPKIQKFPGILEVADSQEFPNIPGGLGRFPSIISASRRLYMSLLIATKMPNKTKQPAHSRPRSKFTATSRDFPVTARLSCSS